MTNSGSPLNPPILDDAAFGIAKGETAAALQLRLGISQRTLWRWKAKPEFKRRVAELRAELMSTALGRAAEGATKASDKLIGLLDSKKSGIVLAAAKALLQLSGQLFASVQLRDEVAEMNRKLSEIEAAQKAKP